MLFDPRHNKTPSLAGFALFVASKPADEAYDYRDCRCCAVGQYLISLEIDPRGPHWNGVISVADRIALGPSVLGNMFDESCWTFGQLADRILEYQKENIGAHIDRKYGRRNLRVRGALHIDDMLDSN